MLEIIVFGLTLVVSNVVATLIIMKVLTSPKVLRKYMNTVTDISMETTKKMLQQMGDEDL